MLETFNFRVILEYMPLFLRCFWATLWLSSAGLLGALIVGTVACGMRISRFKLLVWAAGAYIESIRSTPLLVQLFFFYFGLPSLGIRMSEAATGILALTLNSGAYMAEIIDRCDPAVPARAGHRAGEGLGAALPDLAARANPRRADHDLGALHAGRGIFDLRPVLFAHLLQPQMLDPLVAEAADLYTTVEGRVQGFKGSRVQVKRNFERTWGLCSRTLEPSNPRTLFCICGFFT